MKKKKVVIIGAGPAGLTAAYELLNKSKDYEITIVEESNDIGGISKTVQFDGMRMDTGIHRFFSKDQRVNDLWTTILPIQGFNSYDDKITKTKKSLVSGGPNPEKEDNVMLIKNRVTRIYYNKKFFDYPVSMKKETIANMGFFTTIVSGFSYLKSCIFKKKETSLENFYINRFGKKLYSMFFEKYTEKVWGRHPSNISADWGSQRVKGLSIIKIIQDVFNKKKGLKTTNNTETSLIEQFWYPKLGAGQIWEEMAKKIEQMGGKIIKNHLVKYINTKNYEITSVVCINDDKIKEISCDILLSSMPIKDLISGLTGDKVPVNVKKIATSLPYREFMAVGLVVKKINLKNKTNIKTVSNIIPDNWIYMQENDVVMGRIQVFNNWSPYLFENPKSMKDNFFISAEYFCNEGDKYWNMSDEEFIKFAEKELIKLNIIDENSVIKSHRIKIKKAYPAYFDSYYQIDKVIEYINKFNNLYCIGRNGQHRYNNMDHSMVTGMEAVNNILNNISDKSNIWNVNTDKEYHEIKVAK